MTVELYKLFTRPRTWISVLLICALPLMVAVFVAAAWANFATKDITG